MSTILYLYLGSSLLLVVLSIPMILRKVPPNLLYGFRVRKTLEDREVWYDVNAYAGKWLLATGLGSSLCSVVIYFIPGLSIDKYALACLGAFSVLLAICLWQSFRYLKERAP